jgi:hypothetical protein
LLWFNGIGRRPRDKSFDAAIGNTDAPHQAEFPLSHGMPGMMAGMF